MYIGGLKNGLVLANLTTDSQTGKSATLMALHNDTGKNSFWRSSTLIIDIGGSGIHQNNGKSSMRPPTFRQPQPAHFGQNNCASHVSLKNNGKNMPPIASDRRDSLRMRDLTLKAMASPLYLTKRSIEREVLPTTRNATCGTKPRNEFLLKSSASVVDLMLVLIVVKLATCSTTILSRIFD